MLNQKEATYKIIRQVFKNNNISFNDGEDAKSLLTTQLKAKVRSTLFDDIRSGKVEVSDEFKGSKLSNDTELSKYVAGLLSNWLRKDKRLNGNIKHEIKNPGVRAGQSDAQIRELRKLLVKVKGTTHESKVEEALAKRIAEVKAEKDTSQTIDVSVIPESLKELV